MINVNKIKTIITKSCESILSAQSFSDRLEKICEVIDNEIPKKSLPSAIFGPITDMGDYMERTEIDQLLQIIRQSASTGQEYCTTDAELNSVLMLIYGFYQEAGISSGLKNDYR